MSQHQSNLSPERLVNLIDTTWRDFSDTLVPLTNNQRERIKRCSLLVTTDPSTIHKNVPKKRAYTILNDIMGSSEELFFLCALSVTPTELGTMKSDAYLANLLEWRKEKTCPKGLRYAIEHDYSLMPKKKATHDPAYRTILQEEDLANFMKSYSGMHGSFMIRIPDNINEDPAIEISRDMCQALIKYVMEKTQERMKPIEAPQEQG
ncbi:hypothetical protein N7499_006335 [Penicillium canescens]|nr:hypothetical protein N7522_004044 [Penicillium canescens]KAJ6081461.1 hypothetical protein N7499_006335 [Penicillium canescens]KAJ6176742.1 hypothetical protein N7485_003656 [Penicillium canescens]